MKLADLRLVAGDLRRALGVRTPADVVRVALSGAGDAKFDSQLGIQTGGLAASRGGLGHYRGVRVAPFAALLESLAPDKTAGFVDLGCGKGRALIVAARYGFENLTGVEIAAAYLEQARQNCEIAGRGLPRARFTLKLGDAAGFEPRADDGVFFSYDCLPEETIRAIAAKLQRSFDAHPRPLHWIYHNNLVRRAPAAAELVRWRTVRHEIQGNYFFVSSIFPRG